MIRVLIVDNNIELCGVISDFLQQSSDFEVVGEAYDGQEGLRKIKAHKPDILVLDLAMPRIDGLGVLEQLEEDPPKTTPGVLMLTAFGHDELIGHLQQFGIDQFIYKPFRLTDLADRLRMIAKRGGPESMPGSAKGRDQIEQDVTAYLVKMGLPSHYKGFGYLKEAVVQCALHGFSAGTLTKELYPSLAETFETSAGAVEAGIRNAITTAWEQGNRKYLQQLCRLESSDRAPTNSFLIARLVESMEIGTPPD